MLMNIIITSDGKAPILATNAQIRLLKEDGYVQENEVNGEIRYTSKFSKDFLMGVILGYRNDSRKLIWE